MKKPSLWWRVLVNRVAMLLVGTTVLYAHAGTFMGPGPVELICKEYTGGTIVVSPDFPCDIPGPGGAPKASLRDAAKFAWQEFIALNWPAKIEQGAAFRREVPDRDLKFGNPDNAGPLVWHTYRGKVEIYPGKGAPPGYKDSPLNDYGYDSPPAYIYGSGEIEPESGKPSAKTPFVNLDENSQISLNQIFAGKASSISDYPKNKILFMAKGNRMEYKYVASNGWWGQKEPPFSDTANYIKKHRADPPPGSSDLVSFLPNTVEIKAAWRKLGENEDPNRYYRATVRYYVEVPSAAVNDPNAKTIKYRDEELALIGLHIIHKTNSAPYFTYATFEQTDNIVDASGDSVEGSSGQPAASSNNGPKPTPMTPNIISHNASKGTYQTFNKIPDSDFLSDPGKQLYYQNAPNTGIPTKGYPGADQKLSNIIVNRRINEIPKDIRDVNREAELVILTYAGKYDSKGETPMRYYRLTNVQYKPMDKSVYGSDYAGADVATYYQSNSVIETDYNLQRFSGQFHKTGPDDPYKYTITDFCKPDQECADSAGHEDGKFRNVAFNGSLVNMGGCMGCHGNGQRLGNGFSFILGDGRVVAPDVANAPITPEQVARFARYFSAHSK